MVTFEQAAFFISIVSLLVSIASFTFYGNKNPGVRYGLGAFFLVLAFIFGLIGVISYIGDIGNSTSQSTPSSWIPNTPEEAASKWGGNPEWWHPKDRNGWVVEAAMNITVEDGWRIDYVDPSGAIRSCGDKYEPGVYGPTTVNVSGATLWYVPGENRCPDWTIWSQSHR